MSSKKERKKMIDKNIKKFYKEAIDIRRTARVEEGQLYELPSNCDVNSFMEYVRLKKLDKDHWINIQKGTKGKRLAKYNERLANFIQFKNHCMEEFLSFNRPEDADWESRRDSRTGAVWVDGEGWMDNPPSPSGVDQTTKIKTPMRPIGTMSPRPSGVVEVLPTSRSLGVSHAKKTTPVKKTKVGSLRGGKLGKKRKPTSKRTKRTKRKRTTSKRTKRTKNNRTKKESKKTTRS